MVRALLWSLQWEYCRNTRQSVMHAGTASSPAPALQPLSCSVSSLLSVYREFQKSAVNICFNQLIPLRTISGPLRGHSYIYYALHTLNVVMLLYLESSTVSLFITRLCYWGAVSGRSDPCLDSHVVQHSSVTFSVLGITYWDLTCFPIAHFYEKYLLIRIKLENYLDRGHVDTTLKFYEDMSGMEGTVVMLQNKNTYQPARIWPENKTIPPL